MNRFSMSKASLALVALLAVPGLAMRPGAGPARADPEAPKRHEDHGREAGRQGRKPAPPRRPTSSTSTPPRPKTS